ncbi:hypothetical protein [Ktedonospora formicarum]|uniref:Uncharacterized protein n=1 Tax=Ktedonospora formicarum TaxID=2778364 RepID=A0A8J3MWG6_9CHLR|nr:hypothetical protein [Ktedonospora formicarum]GHO51417.1 hypothetical protein KSX_95800 [Ktedonospora formicarum]
MKQSVVSGSVQDLMRKLSQLHAQLQGLPSASSLDEATNDDEEARQEAQQRQQFTRRFAQEVVGDLQQYLSQPGR